MRSIASHPEPPELAAARPNLPAHWNNLHGPVFGPVKAAIRDGLYRHQYGLCAFCEGSLGELGRHIEHIEPKGGMGGNPSRMFDYDNLVASCQGDQQVGQSADSCGHWKDRYINSQGTFVLADFISPREAGCNDKFKYLHDGRIVPKAAAGTPDHARAGYTIKVAGLDCNRLRSRRRKIAEKHIRQIARFHGNPAALQQLVNHYLGPHTDSQGATVLLPFYSTRKQRFIP